MSCGHANCLHTATAWTEGTFTNHAKWQVGRQHVTWKCRLFAYSYSYSMDKRRFCSLKITIIPAAEVQLTCAFEEQQLLKKQCYTTDRRL